MVAHAATRWHDRERPFRSVHERLRGRLSKNGTLRRHSWIDMRFIAQICLIWSVLFVTAHRLPAPIVEEEKSTPPAAVEGQTAKRSSKANRRSTEAPEESKPAEAPKPK